MQSENQPYEIGRCICNCPIYRVGEEIVYTCEEYPCYPQDGELEEKDENQI